MVNELKISTDYDIDETVILRRDRYHRNILNLATVAAAKLSSKIPIYHYIQISTYGGSGSTAFMHFFLNNMGAIPRCNNNNATFFKHMRTPPMTPLNPDFVALHPFKAMYIFGDPILAVISLFTRFKAKEHAVALQSPYQDLFDNNWSLDAYLDKCLEKNRDLLQLEDHFLKWTGCPKKGRKYPILLVRYETMWDHLHCIFNFLQLPISKISDFPAKKQRTSSLDSVSNETKEKLFTIYGSFAERVRSFRQGCQVCEN